MYRAIIPLRSPVTIETAETEFLPAMRDLARKYCELRDSFQLPASCMPAAEIQFDGDRVGHVSYNGGIWRRDASPFSRPALIVGAL